ncbi:MAG TPA: response regulator [Candidatus Polarisedimenticolia bacterium]|nr:response regulator [Candidatus Polarisedimenticolia bacterium]
MTQILVVDDEAAIREVLIEFLSDHGYTAEGAESGPACLALATALRPQIVLLDIAMPGMNGIETLKKLRGQSPETAVIMISGHADQAMALEALDLGAYDFIQKPLDFGYLERTLLAKIVTLEPMGDHAPGEETHHEAKTGRGRRAR